MEVRPLPVEHPYPVAAPRKKLRARLEHPEEDASTAVFSANRADVPSVPTALKTISSFRRRFPFLLSQSPSRSRLMRRMSDGASLAGDSFPTK